MALLPTKNTHSHFAELFIFFFKECLHLVIMALIADKEYGIIRFLSYLLFMHFRVRLNSPLENNLFSI